MTISLFSVLMAYGTLLCRDVLENQEVSDFVEAYRYSTIREQSMAKYNDIVKPELVPIAQLLCEEARARWLTVVEAEDVLIDDISCIVIEFKDSEIRGSRPPNRCDSPLLPKPMYIHPSDSSAKTTKTVIRDPRRGSLLDNEEIRKTELATKLTAEMEDKKKANAEVRDPRRSSLSNI